MGRSINSNKSRGSSTSSRVYISGGSINTSSNTIDVFTPEVTTFPYTLWPCFKQFTIGRAAVYSPNGATAPKVQWQLVSAYNEVLSSGLDNVSTKVTKLDVSPKSDTTVSGNQLFLQQRYISSNGVPSDWTSLELKFTNSYNFKEFRCEFPFLVIGDYRIDFTGLSSGPDFIMTRGMTEATIPAGNYELFVVGAGGERYQADAGTTAYNWNFPGKCGQISKNSISLSDETTVTASISVDNASNSVVVNGTTYSATKGGGNGNIGNNRSELFNEFESTYGYAHRKSHPSVLGAGDSGYGHSSWARYNTWDTLSLEDAYVYAPYSSGFGGGQGHHQYDTHAGGSNYNEYYAQAGSRGGGFGAFGGGPRLGLAESYYTSNKIDVPASIWTSQYSCNSEFLRAGCVLFRKV